MKFVTSHPKNYRRNSENFPLKVRRNVEAKFKFSSRKLFYKIFSWTRTMQIGEDCRNVFVRCLKILCRKCTQNGENVIFLIKKTFFVPTLFWTEGNKLLPSIPKILRSKSDTFKIYEEKQTKYY